MDARVLGSSSLVEGLWHGPGDLPLFPATKPETKR